MHVCSQAESSDLAQVRVACLASAPGGVEFARVSVRAYAHRFRVKREVFGEKRKFTVLDNVPSTASYHKHCVSVRTKELLLRPRYHSPPACAQEIVRDVKETLCRVSEHIYDVTCGPLGRV